MSFDLVICGDHAPKGSVVATFSVWKWKNAINSLIEQSYPVFVE